MKKLLLITILSFLVVGCNTTKQLPATAAVIQPSNLTCKSCIQEQQKYLNELFDIANQSPYSMKVDSFGFLEFKGKKYLSLDLVGNTYNTIQTTTQTRLSNEFIGKYKTIASLMLSGTYKNEIDGIRVLLSCSSYNFVSDTYATNLQNENLELFSSQELVSSFIGGDITAQELINKSLVFINGQRMSFSLKMM